MTPRSRTQAIVPWLPVVALSGVAFVVTRSAAPAAVMLVFATTQFVGYKAWTLLAGVAPLHDRGLRWGYAVGWPGLDPAPFRRRRACAVAAAIGPWVCIGLGSIGVWGVPRMLVNLVPWMAGLCGFGGLILVVHFGLFGLLARLWQGCGVAVRPIMHIPPWPRSVSAWWSSGWNVAFRDLAHRAVFRPLARCGPVQGALVAVFVFSGLVHEWVISVPAAGGYGQPLLYFVLQAVAVLVERSPAGRRWGLMTGVRGRLFTLAVVALPVPLLFHRPFVERVVLPMLAGLGAL